MGSINKLRLANRHRLTLRASRSVSIEPDRAIQLAEEIESMPEDVRAWLDSLDVAVAWDWLMRTSHLDPEMRLLHFRNVGMRIKT